jgi:hypothetical protein
MIEIATTSGTCPSHDTAVQTEGTYGVRCSTLDCTDPTIPTASLT